MLNFSGVTVRLADKVVLQDISFAQKSGEFIGIIGPNGAGKSSLLNTVQRTVPCLQGDILLKQRSLKNYTAAMLAKTVAVVSQNAAPIFALTVLQIVIMGRLPHKSWFEHINDHDLSIVDHALAQVGLSDKKSLLVSALSGGEQQRLYIARALVQQPDLMLLDEPTNHLDIQYQHQVLQLVRQLNISVLACLHDLNLAALYCDKILLLQQGQLRAFGSPEQVLQPDLLQQVFGLPCQVSHHQTLNKLQVTFLPPHFNDLPASAKDILC